MVLMLIVAICLAMFVSKKQSFDFAFSTNENVFVFDDVGIAKKAESLDFQVEISRHVNAVIKGRSIAPVLMPGEVAFEITVSGEVRQTMLEAMREGDKTIRVTRAEFSAAVVSALTERLNGDECRIKELDIPPNGYEFEKER